MDIIEFAIEKEKIAIENYRKLANESKNKGFAKIFAMLADEEEKHAKAIQQMAGTLPEEVTQTDVLGEAKSIFENLRADLEKFKNSGNIEGKQENYLRAYIKNSDFDMTEVKLYKKARELEEQSREFYQQKAKQADNDRQKKLFLQLAAEENKHYLLIDNMVEMMTEPELWLENAEWYHLEDY